MRVPLPRMPKSSAGRVDIRLTSGSVRLVRPLGRQAIDHAASAPGSEDSADRFPT